VHSEPDLRQLLRLHTLFAGIEAEEFEALFSQVAVRSIRHFDTGSVVFEKGMAAQSCFVVLEGAVDVLVSGQRVGRCDAGQLLGELGLIGGDDVHQADAVAAEASILLEVPADQFGGLLSKSPTFSLNVVRALAGKLRWTTDDSARSKVKGGRYHDVLKRHVSPPVMQFLLARHLGMEVPQMLHHAIVLFADIQDYTRHTQDMTDPVRLAEELSRYFRHMTTLVHAHGGVVNAFLGDGLLAFWGFPAMPENGESLALDCALKMHAEASCFTLGSGPIANRIGLAAGEVFCGIVGHPPVEQFTILGDVVNLAARLEQANKETGTGILLACEALGEAAQRLRGSLPEGFGDFVDVSVEAKGYARPIDCLGLRYQQP
jgi:class 3 adenylate cyclase